MADDMDNISRLMENLDDLFKDHDTTYKEVMSEKEQAASQIIEHLLDKKYITPESIEQVVLKYRIHPMGFSI